MSLSRTSKLLQYINFSERALKGWCMLHTEILASLSPALVLL